MLVINVLVMLKTIYDVINVSIIIKYIIIALSINNSGEGNVFALYVLWYVNMGNSLCIA